MHVEAVQNLGEPEIFIFTETENPDQNEKLIFAGMNESETGSDGDLKMYSRPHTIFRTPFFPAVPKRILNWHNYI